MAPLHESDVVLLRPILHLRRSLDFQILSEGGDVLGAISEVGMSGWGRVSVGRAFESLRRHEWEVTDPDGAVMVRAAAERTWLRLRGTVRDPLGRPVASLQQAKRVGPIDIMVMDDGGRLLGRIKRMPKVARYAVALFQELGPPIAVGYPIGPADRGWQHLFTSYRLEFRVGAAPWQRVLVLGAVPILHNALVAPRALV